VLRYVIKHWFLYTKYYGDLIVKDLRAIRNFVWVHIKKEIMYLSNKFCTQINQNNYTREYVRLKTRAEECRIYTFFSGILVLHFLCVIGYYLWAGIA